MRENWEGKRLIARLPKGDRREVRLYVIGRGRDSHLLFRSYWRPNPAKEWTGTPAGLRLSWDEFREALKGLAADEEARSLILKVASSPAKSPEAAAAVSPGKGGRVPAVAPKEMATKVHVIPVGANPYTCTIGGGRR